MRVLTRLSRILVDAMREGQKAGKINGLEMNEDEALRTNVERQLQALPLDPRFGSSMDRNGSH